MLETEPIYSLAGLLSMAEQVGIIDGWKFLGPVVAVRCRDGNYYVRMESTALFLEGLTAKC